MRRILLVMLAAPIVVGTLPAAQEPGRVSQVGLPQEIRDLVLAGTELEVAPTNVTTPVVVRLDAVRPHGDAHRYDLVWYGLDPGEYDLTDYLERKDGSSTDDLSPVPIRVDSVLPPGQVQPNRIERSELPPVGGYRALLWIGGILWVVLGVVLFTSTRKRRAAEGPTEAAEPTLAERLRPLVEDAVAGRLSSTDRAELELTLIAFWRDRLGLAELEVGPALARLKAHSEAGPLVRSLEDWLHRPGPAADVDVEALLAPYRHAQSNSPSLGPGH